MNCQEPIHDRMPVVLTDDAYDAWLRDDADPRKLKALLAPYPAAAMKSFQVREKVNSALVDEPQLPRTQIWSAVTCYRFGPRD
jgi:putative SOS response-associated peptidase YedK